jgi:hypothetical protein
MKLDTPERANLFGSAQRAHKHLGALFQNPMELDKDIIQEEISIAENYRDHEVSRYNSYIAKLNELSARIKD